jgi:hypothetical protein
MDSVIFFIFYLISSIGIAAFIFFILMIILYFSQLIFQSDIPLTFPITIILSIVTAFIVSRYSFLKNRQQEHFLALKRLISELNDNYERMETFAVNYNEVKEKWLNQYIREMAWIPNKKPSYGFSTYVYQYFPCAAFNNFMNRGHFLDIPDSDKLEKIMLLYSISINLSNHIQDNEVKIARIIESRSREVKGNQMDTSSLTSAATADLRFVYPQGRETNDPNSVEDYCEFIEEIFSSEKIKFKNLFETSNITDYKGMTIKYWWQIKEGF